MCGWFVEESSSSTGLDNLFSFRDKQILQEPCWMLAFINVFDVKSIWRIRLNEKIFDFRVLALNVFVTSDVLRVFHHHFWWLLTVRLLFIVSFNMQFSRCRTVCSLTLQTFLTVYQSFETKIVFDLKSTVNFFINPAATCFPMPSPA